MSLSPVLYIDDDPDDIRLMELAFKDAGVQNPLVIQPDGNAAVEYLSGSGRYQRRDQYPLPCLLLMDIKIPGMSGLEILKWIRGQPSVSTLPVLMLTVLADDADVHRAYLMGANGYLLKPDKIDGMVAMAKGIRDFWLGLNRNAALERGPYDGS